MEKSSGKTDNQTPDIKIIELSGTPLNYEPIASPNYVIGICHKGRFEANYDYQHVVFNPRELAIVYPNHIVVPTLVSPDYKATIIDVPAPIFYSLLNHFISRDRFRYESAPSIPLSAEQYGNLMSLINAMRTIDSINFSIRRQMKMMMTEIIIEIMNHYHSLIHPDGSDNNIKILSKRFFQAVIDHCNEHHDVAFYADLFHLSPKYFSTAIARETGHNALYWIQFYLTAKAKQMLYLQSDTPIKTISDQLGFNDFATFSRFFKHLVGIPPTEWRQRTCLSSNNTPQEKTGD